MHSGGGIISLENAAEFPVQFGGIRPRRRRGLCGPYRRASSAWIRCSPSTWAAPPRKFASSKTRLRKTARVFEVARTYRFKKGSGMPISIPVIDMVEIGAGGGSLAHVDSLRQIRVGPESAGSEPGPACYGRGWLPARRSPMPIWFLGRLDPANNFAGGRHSRLDAAASRLLPLQTQCGRSARHGRPKPAAFGLAVRSWTKTWPMPPASMRWRTAKTSANTP